jgi:hypothetical protein
MLESSLLCSSTHSTVLFLQFLNVKNDINPRDKLDFLNYVIFKLCEMTNTAQRITQNLCYKFIL